MRSPSDDHLIFSLPFKQNGHPTFHPLHSPLVRSRPPSSSLTSPITNLEYLPPHSKVKTAQKLWNTTDAARIALAYTPDSTWRNRGTFVKGREEIERFLEEKWRRERNYTLRKEVGRVISSPRPSLKVEVA